jgi:hypothetical protein
MWYTAIIPAIWEVEIGGSQFGTNLSKTTTTTITTTKTPFILEIILEVGIGSNRDFSILNPSVAW